MLGALVLVLAADSSVAGTSALPSFCEGGVVHDYERPLKRMPKVHMPPSSGRLPFGPPRTLLTQPENRVLVAEGGLRPEFSYGFSSYSTVERAYALNWHIQMNVLRVNGRGNPIEVAGRLKRNIGTVTDAEFSRISLPFSLTPKKAFYRVNLIFKKKNGSLLGQYSQYLRVVRPTVAVKLALRSKVVRVGELLQFRVQNAGTTRVNYGEPFEIEKFDEAGWSIFLNEAELGPWRRVIHSLFGGVAGKCQSFMVPVDMSPGQYRIRKDLARPVKTITAEFEVAP